MPFLDGNVFSENGKFVTKKRKETFTGVYTNMSSFIPLQRKFGLIYTSLYHSLCLVSDICKFHFEIEKLKEMLLSNEYFDKFIDMCISKYMNKLNIKKLVMLTNPKKARNAKKACKEWYVEFKRYSFYFITPWLIIHCLTDCNNKNDDRIINNNNNNNNNNNKVGTRNGVGKLKRKTRVGFRIPSTQNRNGERT